MSELTPDDVNAMIDAALVHHDAEVAADASPHSPATAAIIAASPKYAAPVATAEIKLGPTYTGK